MIIQLRRFAALEFSEITLLRCALVVLIHVRISLWTRPWRRFTSYDDPSLPRSASSPAADRLEWAVRTASRFIPGATCLTQALALQRLLSRHGYRSVVQIGVRNADRRFTAHAWVEHNGRPLLTSAAEIDGYSRFFSWPAGTDRRP